MVRRSWRWAPRERSHERGRRSPGAGDPRDRRIGRRGIQHDPRARPIGGCLQRALDRALPPLGAIREVLKLHRPIYQKTAAYGHFGREDHDFTWERVDRAEDMRRAAGLEGAEISATAGGV